MSFSVSKPAITSASHELPFDRLSPRDFERLCLWLVEREGFEDVEHLGAAGSEQGRDVVARREGRQWAFQCKRVKRFGPTAALAEIDKVLAMPEEQHPAVYVFVVACDVSANTRQQIRDHCAGRLECRFWCGTELDEKVKQHPDILEEFFQVDYGTIRIYPVTRSSLIRAVPPRSPAHFSGREAELEQLENLLTSAPSGVVIALQGMGGVGKTALARKVSERLVDQGCFPGGILWWPLGPDPDIMAALDVWARHVDHHVDLSSLLNAESRANLVRSMLAQLGRLCIVLDDAWEYKTTQVLMSAVPPSCPVLVTTRNVDLAKSLRCRVERIDTLNEEEAVLLLARLLGPLGALEPTAREVARLCGGLPLAIEIAAGLADSVADLSALARKLGEESALSILRLPGVHARDKSVEACLRLSYDSLDSDMQRRFRGLGVFPSGHYTQAAIAAVWGESEHNDAVLQTLRYLARRNLIGYLGNGRYEQHMLLHTYASALLGTASEYEEVAARHAVYFTEFARNHQNEYKKIVGERANLRAVFTYYSKMGEDYDRELIDFVSTVQSALEATCYWGELIPMLESAQCTCERVKDHSRRATLLVTLAKMCINLADYESAALWAEEAETLARQMEDKATQADALLSEGWAHLYLAHYDLAIDYLSQAELLARQVEHQGILAAALHFMSRAYGEKGAYEKALDCIDAESRLDAEAVAPEARAFMLLRYGLALLEVREIKRAEELVFESMRLFESLGQRGGIAHALRGVACVLLAKGNAEEALRLLTRSLHDIGYKRGEANVRQDMVSVHIQLGNLDEARMLIDEVIQYREESNERRYLADALYLKGQVLESEGDTVEALKHHKESLALLEQIKCLPTVLEKPKAAVDRLELITASESLGS